MWTAAVMSAIVLMAPAALGQEENAMAARRCDAYTAVQVPAEAQSVVTPKVAPGCASYRSYRGIGRPVNYAETRACAWKERAAQKAELGQNGKEPTAWVIGGSLILADIYFNGAGVAVNRPLAMRFACEAEESMAELAMDHLAKAGSPSDAKKPFEFCDYSVTTFTMNFCSSYKAQVQDDQRDREYRRLASAMPPDQRVAFETLLSAERAYLGTHASEVYQGGSIHNIRTRSSQNILDDLFHGELMQLKRKHWPALSQAEVAGANLLEETERAKAIQRINAQPKDKANEDITADGFAKAQAAWEAYRTAWVVFARLLYPEHAAAVRAEITLDRYRLLKTIP